MLPLPFLWLLINVSVAITDLGQFPALQIDPITGSIVIAYGSASGLKISICEPEQCSVPRTTQPGCTPPLASASLTLINGAPFVAYAVMQRSSSAALFGLSCSDLACSTYTTAKLGQGSDLGYAVAAIQAPSSNPVVTYIDRSLNNIAVATCLDRACKSTTINYLQTLAGAFYHTYGSTDIGFMDDLNHTAVVSFQQWSPNGTEGTLKLAVCKSSTCSDASVDIIDPNAAEYTSLALVADRDNESHIMVAYTDEVYKQLRIADCRAPARSEISCSIKAVVTTTQMITSPVIRSWRSGQAVIAYFQSWSGRSGGALYLIRCRTERCRDENPTDAVMIDSSPLWITSQMQIALELRPFDGRPVLAYSVYEAPLTFLLKVAICLTETCHLSRIFNIDNFRNMAQITLKFDIFVFLKGELVMIAFTIVTVAFALYIPNKARLVNVYMISPFTRDVLVNVNCRNVVGMLLLGCTFGALLSSLPWLVYAGHGAMDSIWHMFFLCLVPVGASAIAYIAVLRCSSRNLLVSGVLLGISILIFLNLLLTYTIGSYAFDCETISVPVPRDLSLCGIVIMSATHLMNLFLCLRIYIALSLASPALLPSRWDEDL